MKNKERLITHAYEIAKERYAELGVNTDAVLKKLSEISISMHCWQGDDVGGFEHATASLDGGIMATGNYPGKARNADELRKDIEKALSLIPGKHRVNLHAIYLETKGKKIERDSISPENFSGWIAWAKEKNIKLDFNPTFFSHPKAQDGFTLSHSNPDIRKFWIEHGKRCREIAEVFASELDDICIINYWVPDGMKDFPADRWTPRKRLKEAYDEIFSSPVNKNVKESLESKLFGIGSEEYVVGSSEFYLSYAVSRNKILCMDLGHYHPTECVYDKISALMNFVPKLLLHISRPVRWDSDHVVCMDDQVVNLARELVRGNVLQNVYIATDYFDASINRIAAWVIGMRNIQKALLFAMLDPIEKMISAENNGDFALRLSLMEEAKTMPFGTVWDKYCLDNGVPLGMDWFAELKNYEKEVLLKRL